MGFSALYVGGSPARKDFFGARLTAVSGGRRRVVDGWRAGVSVRVGSSRAHVLGSSCRRDGLRGACRGVAANDGARSGGAGGRSGPRSRVEERVEEIGLTARSNAA